MKYIFGSILCVFVLACLSQASQVVYEEGARAAGDGLLSKVTIKERFRLGQVVTKDYTYTTTGTITYIKVTDEKLRKGATVEKTGGGVGGTTVSFTFTSRRNFGIKDVVEIYGTP